jgi:hypothetical protein
VRLRRGFTPRTPPTLARPAPTRAKCALIYKEEPMAKPRLPDLPKPTDPAPLAGPAGAPRPPRARRSPADAPARVQLTPEARRALIAETAYLRAERRGFEPGHETEDWLAAETEVDALLKVEQGASPQ